MKSRFFIQVLIVCLLLVMVADVGSPSCLSSDKQPPAPSGQMILYVGGAGPGNYSSIQDAVNNASDGDTVFVYAQSAPYYENIIINVSIFLLGEDRNTTSIEGGSHAVSIYANGVTVSGFRISNVGDFWNCCGFYVISDGNTISQNNIVNNLRMNGVFLDGGSYNVIAGNIIENNKYHGIRLEYSSHNVISDNRIVNNRGYGMYLWESSDNVIMRNTVMLSFWEGLLIGENSAENRIFHNNFIENLRNAFDATGNVWDNGSAGNFWSDYDGVDGNGDGIGDSPYLIAGDVSVDYFPLMRPFGETEHITIRIQGGFGVSVMLTNMGSEDLLSVEWCVDFEGGVMLPLQKTRKGTIDLLQSGSTVRIRPAPVLLGLGVMKITVTAGSSTVAYAQGVLLLCFFFVSS